jgi:TolB-like protein/DNA-binding SARP family transcriptional activator
MYRLLALGGLVLERDGAPLDDVVRNRKALALLAALAVHGGLGRERITALLWPESDADRAKGSLNQAVHMLRRRLAEPELFLGTAELRLNPARIDSDVGLFTRAVGDGDLETAVAFYRGPFLEGVHLEGTPEFERWADERRAELGARYGQALETLALEAEARSDPRAAVEWWRRLQATDPFSTRVALRLMRALEAAGDPAAALRHARAHETLLRDELGIPPDPAIAERVARLRSTPTAEIVALAGEIAAGDRGLATSPGEVAIPSGEARTQAGALAARRAGRRLAVPLAVLTLLALAAGVALVAGVAGRANGGGGSAGPVSLVVLPFVDLSPDGDQEYFADGITEEILNSLAGIRELRVPARTTSFYFKGRALPVTEIAALLGVDAVLEGSVRRSGDRLRITAQLDRRPGDDRHLWSETFDRDVGDVFSVQEAEIAGIGGRGPAGPARGRRRRGRRPARLRARRPTTCTCGASSTGTVARPRTWAWRWSFSSRRRGSTPTTPAPGPPWRWPTPSSPSPSRKPSPRTKHGPGWRPRRSGRWRWTRRWPRPTPPGP